MNRLAGGLLGFLCCFLPFLSQGHSVPPELLALPESFLEEQRKQAWLWASYSPAAEDLHLRECWLQPSYVPRRLEFFYWDWPEGIRQSVGASFKGKIGDAKLRFTFTLLPEDYAERERQLRACTWRFPESVGGPELYLLERQEVEKPYPDLDLDPIINRKNVNTPKN